MVSRVLDCRTDPDKSENPYVAVDMHAFVKNENKCENRKMGTGIGGEKLTFTEIDDEEGVASSSADQYRIQCAHVALLIARMFRKHVLRAMENNASIKARQICGQCTRGTQDNIRRRG